MNLEESLNKLFSLHQFGIKLGLDKPRKLYAHLGNPQENLKCFHIAGSNAKGSVASFISSVLIEEGYKVGLYTSPHFVKFNERIRINSEVIPDEYIMNFMNDLENYIDSNEPTFFELTTAMAFKYFSESKVDYAVIETGLGGRLDATNVIIPIASIITTISLEHTNILGNTIEEITYEKGEIIKKISEAVIGFLPEAAEMVLEEKCKKEETKLVRLREYVDESEDSIKLEFDQRVINLYSTPLFGKYQRRNSALAILTLLKAIDDIKSNSIFDGIKNVVKNSGIQGRYEVYNESPKIIFDSSHNSEGIDNFINEFKSEAVQYERKEIIFGVMKDKDIAGMIKKFEKIFDKIHVTSFEYERAAKINDVIKIGNEQGLNVEGLENPVKYITDFKLKNENKCLVILGSIYLLGDIKSKLLN